MNKAEAVVAMREGKAVRSPETKNSWIMLIPDVMGVEVVAIPVGDWQWFRPFSQDGWEIVEAIEK